MVEKAKTSIFDIPIYISDNSKVLKTYKWRPTRNMKTIVIDIYKWLLNNKKVWKYFKMSVALITGSCGLVGSEASLYFAKKGFEILGIDNNSRKFFFGRDGDISWVKKRLKKY